MILSAMQPYFFPYLGYFDLICRADRWIVFDTPQYMREGWVNRNRVLHSSDGWQYITVPLKKHHRDTAINKVEAVDFPDWRRKIVNQFTHYRGRAPYWRETIALLDDCLTGTESNLARINVRALGKVCAYLGITWRPEILSEMGITLGPVEESADWALRIAEAVGADVYLNPPGGAALYDAARFAAAGIQLKIQDDFSFEYECPGYIYQPRLSILDVLMWNTPDAVNAYLSTSRLTPA